MNGELSGAPRPLARDVALRWRDALARLGAGAAVARNLGRLEQGAACVVTGQQAGVLTGPLLTILKAARAVSLARELEASTGRPVVPVFWVAADDHDLDEIHHTFVLNRAGEAQKLRLELHGARGAAGAVAAPTAASSFVDELWSVAGIDPAVLPPDRFRPRAGDSLATWFARCLLELLGEQGLVPFEPALFGDAARPLHEQALRDDGAIERALKEGAAALASRGLVAPLPVEADPPLFVIEPGSRTRVRRRGRELFVGERPTTAAALLELAGNGQRLSANVALRPILQAALLPTLAYVAGPTEALYFEQLRPLHALFGVPYPHVAPRPQATVLTVAGARALRKLGGAPRSVDELCARLDARKSAPATASPLQTRGAALRSEVAGYVAELLAASPAVKSAAERRATQLLQSFDAMLERAQSALADGDQAAAQRLALLEPLLRPRGRPQERSLNVLPFLAERGPALIDAFLRLRGEPGPDGVVPHPLLFEDAANG